MICNFMIFSESVGSGACISCAITCVKATKQSRIAVKIECLFIIFVSLIVNLDHKTSKKS